jgi:methionyl-tRNA formyltransferase
MKCAVVGGVQSTAVLIKALHHHGFGDVRVYGFEPPSTKLVSGWTNLKIIAERCSFGYRNFHKVTECQEDLENYKPDVLFVVGLSQIIPEKMLKIAKLINVGFHPTALPKGRGRAAIAWLILNESNGAATFFEIQKGVDDGDVLVQEPYEVSSTDYAYDVENKILNAEKLALDNWLPKLKTNQFIKFKQDESAASWYGKRSPEDGWIDWSQDTSFILKSIRANSKPHPGAYTFYNDCKIVVWKAMRHERNETGVIGRILNVFDDQSFIVQSSDGIIMVSSWYSDSGWKPRIGMKLGFYLELENFRLRHELRVLAQRLEALESALNDKGK